MYKSIYKTVKIHSRTEQDLEVFKEALSVYDLQVFRLSALLGENLPQLLLQDSFQGSSEHRCFCPLGLIQELSSDVNFHHELRNVHHTDPHMRIVYSNLGGGLGCSL